MTRPHIERLPEVVARVGLSPATIWRAVRAGRFPKPVKLSAMATGWVSADVDRWIEQRIADRDAAPAAEALR